MEDRSSWPTCNWCGKKYRPFTGVSKSIFGPDYCSNKCMHDAESAKASNRRNDDYDDDDSQSLGFFGKIWRAIKITVSALVILTIIGYILDKDDDTKSDNNKKTEQTSTQTAKKQGTTSTKNTNSSKTTASSKPASSKSTTISSSKPANTQTSGSSSNSSSTTSKTNSSTTAQTNISTTTSSASSSAAKSDESYQTYLALMTLLADEGESLKLCEAQNKTRGKEANVIGKMSQLRGTQYYDEALNDLLGYCPRYADEYYKNGKYFASEAEFYQAYIAPDYSKTLKAKKKENR
ncbi:MAG: hypothetical protein J6U04_02485 [Salinivirgaceae bacterium]|nr:hypothetical protein [Salinivirgaceae bacterium]